MEQSTIKLLESHGKYVFTLDISNKNIEGLLDLEEFENLKKLDCSHNKITEIINLPPSLKYFDCSYNQIDCLSGINSDLEYLNCKKNQLYIRVFYFYKLTSHYMYV